MAKNVKSSIQLTDMFVIQRENSDDGKLMKTVDGFDLASFVDDRQSRFTDEIELKLSTLEVQVDSNTSTINSNNDGTSIRFQKVELDITKNKSDISSLKGIVDSHTLDINDLEADSRTAGYYYYPWYDLIGMDETPPNGGSLSVDLKDIMDPGMVVGLNSNGDPEFYNYRDIVKLVFRKTDIFGDRRNFLGLYRTDLIELLFVGMSDNSTQNYDSRATFKVITQDQDITSWPELGDYIEINVQLINGRGDNKLHTDLTSGGNPHVGIPVWGAPPVVSDKEDKYYGKYIKCSVFPSASVDTEEETKDAVTPIGGVIAWMGDATDINKIPKGWALCDGSDIASLNSIFGQVVMSEFSELIFGNTNAGNKIPDLRGRFICGALPPSVSHGESNMRHDMRPSSNWPAVKHSIKFPSKSTADAGSHTHTVTVAEAGSHSHKIGNFNNPPSGNSNSNNTFKGASSGNQRSSNEPNHSHNTTVSSIGHHKHNISGFGSETKPHCVGVYYIVKIHHVYNT